jgi:hypothetical protein
MFTVYCLLSLKSYYAIYCLLFTVIKTVNSKKITVKKKITVTPVSPVYILHNKYDIYICFITNSTVIKELKVDSRCSSSSLNYLI